MRVFVLLMLEATIGRVLVFGVLVWVHVFAPVGMRVFVFVRHMLVVVVVCRTVGVLVLVGMFLIGHMSRFARTFAAVLRASESALACLNAANERCHARAEELDGRHQLFMRQRSDAHLRGVFVLAQGQQQIEFFGEERLVILKP